MRSRSGAGEHGASMFLVAVSLFMLMGAAAIAVDLAAMRADRSADQKVTDSAAAAGALAVYDGTGQDGCETALAYVGINSEELGAIDTSGCTSSFSTTCTTGESHTVISGRFTITVRYPVEDADALMTSGALGATTQSTVPEDGVPCERVGVQMSAVREGLFGQVLGFQQGTTTVHSVARAFLPPPDGPPINLLLLDRFGCGVLTASGGGSPPPGGIIVDEVVDPVTGEIFPGEGAVDSDASIAGGCPADEGTIDVNGSNAVMRADGPPGCPTEDPPLSGDGCGLFRTLAPGTPGCNWPACTAGGAGPNVPRPPPTALPARITRAPIDHRYNCRTDGYTSVSSDVAWAADPLTIGNEQNIPACEGPHDPRIHDLIRSVREVGLPDGVFVGPWQTWSSLHPDCSVDPGQGFPISGNVWVDCSLLEIKDTVTITDGSMVLDGDLEIVSAGHLIVDNDDPTGTPGFVFMRNGLIRKAGQASLSFLETMVYLSKNSLINMEGGTGNLVWIAPEDEGDPNDPTDDYPFDDLALWSDSTITTANHRWAGQAVLDLEGVFFVPIVTAEYRGEGVQIQTSAQFIADKLHVSGNGVLTLSPVAGRAVDLQSVPRTDLLR